MYGDKALEWMQHRSAFLTPRQALLFSNEFLNDTGLSRYVVDAPVAFAESVV
jgi:hypothetical protein